MQPFVKLLVMCCVLAGLLGLVPPSFAQTRSEPLPTLENKTESVPFDRRRLLVQPRNPDGSIKVVPFMEDPVLWMRDHQQNFYRAMSKTMKSMRGEGSIVAALSLMMMSFAYGVLHAAGPGHGKAVISGWLLATESQLKRGIVIAFMSSVVQALVAVGIVSGALLVLSGASAAAKSIAGYLEGISYAMIAVMGGYLLFSGLKLLAPQLAVSRRLPRPQAGLVPGGPVSSSHVFEIVNPLPAGHVHGPDCGCGHAHVPLPQDVTGAWTWTKAVSLSLAVGIRPCSGAILVLLFANAMGIYWAGVISTFVMSLGTFITVSVVAALAVYSRGLAERLTARNSSWHLWMNAGLRIAGGFAILAFGGLLFLATLQGAFSING